jgi:hypothetical protein
MGTYQNVVVTGQGRARCKVAEECEQFYANLSGVETVETRVRVDLRRA